MSVSAAAAIFRMNKLGGERAPMFRSRSGIKEERTGHGVVQWERNFEIGSYIMTQPLQLHSPSQWNLKCGPKLYKINL
jgi:hypothetical protein